MAARFAQPWLLPQRGDALDRLERLLPSGSQTATRPSVEASTESSQLIWRDRRIQSKERGGLEDPKLEDTTSIRRCADGQRGCRQVGCRTRLPAALLLLVHGIVRPVPEDSTTFHSYPQVHPPTVQFHYRQQNQRRWSYSWLHCSH